ncbi:hydroxymethylbilane synthase [Fibrobacter sp.]|uniref:hydroxymethylbilane synthase n=1 Tax=Fibrobacter sp. TaxID=35828 RepID=UPI00386A7DEB
MSDLKLRIATRKSALALAQTTMAADAIGVPYELVSMTTEGDRRLDKSLASFGGKGVFIKELEIALLEGRADIAIHSLKDMPAEVLPQFKLAAVLKREDPRDAFLSRGGAAGIRFMDLPAGARVGTGSIRRVVQLKALRPDLEYVPIRGNIQTRIGKLAELDGVVLAAAGLKRMGLADQVTEYFSTERVLPASGQGILAIETLNDETAQESRGIRHPERSAKREVEGSRLACNEISQILARANDVATFCIASAEMAYLKALNAGCQFPVASFAEFVDSAENRGARESSIHESSACDACEGDARTLKIRGIYWDENSSRLLRAETSSAIDLNSADSVQQAKNIGIALAREIQKQL